MDETTGDEVVFDAPWLPRPITQRDRDRLGWDATLGPWTPEKWAKYVRRRRFRIVRWWRRIGGAQP